jgi:para-aminobenzoate synthetase component 1
MKPIMSEIKVPFSAETIFALFAQEHYSVFLDSAKDAQKMGRYSFIARDPFLVFTSKGLQVTIQHAGSNKVEVFEANPFDKLKELLKQYRTEKCPDLPPFTNGVIGYFGYDLGYLLEDIPGHSQDDLHVPDCCLGFYDTVLIFDHYEDKCYLASSGFPEQDNNARLVRAQARIQEMRNLLTAASPLPAPQASVPQGDYTCNFKYDDYCAMIQKGIDYISAGDIFEVNLTQRFTAKLTAPPFDLYRYLRHINPAPFASYLNLGDVIVASASPERYMLLQGSTVETRPIKGTRPRGTDPESDRKLREELLNSEKDRAELVMIIDLERNDLGRVCEYGSVRVPDLIRLEEYATVFHLVSTVVGKLSPGKDIIDLIAASFPGGSITGAPKVRSMEIIDELEPVRRGIYTGSIGYLDFNGDADLNIVIRTFVIQKDRVYFQAGGAIVADSVPEKEYWETIDKMRALMQALGYQV